MNEYLNADTNVIYVFDWDLWDYSSTARTDIQNSTGDGYEFDTTIMNSVSKTLQSQLSGLDAKFKICDDSDWDGGCIGVSVSGI